jgi:cytochrome c oxidase subunit II
MRVPIFPDSASSNAANVDALYFFLTGMSLFFLALIFVPLVYFLFKYRRGHPADRSPLQVSTMKLEVVWTIIPLFLALGIFAWGARVFYDMQVPPPDSLEINVVGKQWMWKIQHQQGNREINELHLPVGRTVRLTLASEDVIHSFYIPAFRIKQDVVPGRFTSVWFKPTRVGQYHLFCSELCGADHSRMTGVVTVMEPVAFQKWLIQGAPGNTLAQAGARLFRELGCSGCHFGSTEVRAPRLENIYSKTIPLSDGSMVRVDDRYLRDSILMPASQVVAGYTPVMPTFQGHITEEELLQVIAYLKTLSTSTPEENR